jgi:O-antigen/teichoic acid export membrane protein
MSQSLKRDFLWNTVGVFLQNALSPLLIIAITRINGIQDSGLFSFAFSISMIFWTLSMWGGRTYQVSDALHEFPQRSYLLVRLILGIVAFTGSIVFVSINNYDATMAAIILTLVTLKIIESIADALYGVMQINGRLYIAGKSLLYKAILGFSAFFITDLLTNSIYYACILLVIVNIAVLFLYDIPYARFLHKNKDGIHSLNSYLIQALTIIRRCSAVAAVAFLASFSLNIPRYFLEIMSPGELGYFGILAMPTTLIILVMSFILQPNIVNLTNFYSKGLVSDFNQSIGKIIRTTLLVGLLIMIGAVLFGVPALNIVFGISFDKYNIALFLIIAGGVASALVAIFMNVLTITRHFKWQFYTLIFTNVLLVAVGYFAVLKYGLTGGIAAFTMVNILQVGFMFIIYKRVLRFNI